MRDVDATQYSRMASPYLKGRGHVIRALHDDPATGACLRCKLLATPVPLGRSTECSLSMSTGIYGLPLRCKGVVAGRFRNGLHK